MSMARVSSPGTVTRHIEGVRQGGTDELARLWDHYRGELERVAYATLRRGAHSGAREEAEDAALSAIVRFHQGVGRGRFATVEGRHDLGLLLRGIALRRALHRLKSASRKKRGGRHLRKALGLDQLSASNLGPVEQVDGEDWTHNLLDSLPDATLRLIVQWRIEGYTDGEIAERLGCTRVTVQRKWQCIRTILLPQMRTAEAKTKASMLETF